MTCIVGVVEGDRVFMGGDSAGSVDGWLTIRADQKVFRNGEFIMGFCGSYRMGQLLRYSFTAPKQRRADTYQYMVTSFVDEVRTTLKQGGFARKKEDVEEIDGSFLVGYRGRLFEVESDYQVGEHVDGFAAVGSGASIAQGALCVTQGMEPRKRIRAALDAAERYSVGVRRPFYVQTLEAE